MMLAAFKIQDGPGMPQDALFPNHGEYFLGQQISDFPGKTHFLSCATTVLVDRLIRNRTGHMANLLLCATVLLDRIIL